MSIDIIISMIGPIVLVVNITSMFLCFRPAQGVAFTLALLAVYGTAVHFLFNPLVMYTFLAPYGGMIMLPAMLLLFRGQLFQKIFAFFMQSQLTAMLVHSADALVGSSLGIQGPGAQITFFVLSMILLGAYMALVLLFGQRFFERVFVDGRRGIWAIYAFGAAFSFVISAALQWQTIGVPLYIMLMLFILWSFGVLCFTIINTHEKTAQMHHTQTLELQMSTMREQTVLEKKHRDDMEILRHDMRHEMGVIMELFRAGRGAEAEAIYADWQSSLTHAAPETLCAEPVLNAVFTRFSRRAMEKNIRLYVQSNIPAALPIDTIKLSVIVSNALENALTATDKVPQPDRRAIRVKLIENSAQIGLEMVNPCAGPVAFDRKGLPVTHKAGHGIGVRSIAAFAKENGCLLDFSCLDGKFSMRLVMGL